MRDLQVHVMYIHSSCFMYNSYDGVIRQKVSYVINLRRACAARVTVLAAYERYQQLQSYIYVGKKNKMAIFLKRLRLKHMAPW